jgi:STE24 endopeptidase
LTSLIGLALLGYLIKQPWFFHGLGMSEMSNYAALVLFSLTIPMFSGNTPKSNKNLFL